MRHLKHHTLRSPSLIEIVVDECNAAGLAQTFAERLLLEA